MKRSLTFLFLSLFCISSFLNAQTIFFQEDFEGVDLPDWTITNPIAWRHANAQEMSSAYFNIPEHTRFVGVNDDAVGAGISTSGQLISPEFTLTGTAPKVLIFDAYFIDGDYDADEVALIELYNVSTMTWDTLYSVSGIEGAWQDQIRVEIPSEYDDQTVQIALTYNDGDGWNYGYCVDNLIIRELLDYEATATVNVTSKYLSTTTRQLHPFTIDYSVQSLGLQALTNVEIAIDVETDTGILPPSDTTVLSELSDIYENTYTFIPVEEGTYTFTLSIIDDNSIDVLALDTFTYVVNDEVLIKDDGVADQGLGFGFGNPSWYGYYGGQHELLQRDTLIGMSVYISPFSDPTGSVNFTVNAFDKLGTSPEEELHHSEVIRLGEEDLGTFLYYELPEELPLEALNYVFACGQDTIQGPVGFGFDNTDAEEGFWIISPVAGGGYPWFNTINGNEVTMMIRPHFKAPLLDTSVETLAEELGIQISPNPFIDYITVSAIHSLENAQLTLFDAQGKQVAQTIKSIQGQTQWNLPNLPSGTYFISIRHEQGYWLQQVIKL